MMTKTKHQNEKKFFKSNVFFESGNKLLVNTKNSEFNSPLVSIITVTYNSEKYLEETIRSIVDQNYKNIEYIIIDGGSTDNTLDIIKRYIDKISYVISEKDNGMYDALNKGFSYSTGDIIIFCNSDDLLYSKDTIKNIVESYKIERFCCCYGSVQYVDENANNLYARNPLEFKPRYLVTLGMPFAQPTFFWTRELMDKMGCFNLKYKIVSDYDLIGRLLLNSENIYRIKNYLIKFRKHGESFGDENSLLALKESKQIREIFIKKLNINRINLIFYSIFDRICQRLFQIYN